MKFSKFLSKKPKKTQFLSICLFLQNSHKEVNKTDNMADSLTPPIPSKHEATENDENALCKKKKIENEEDSSSEDSKNRNEKSSVSEKSETEFNLEEYLRNNEDDAQDTSEDSESSEDEEDSESD